jgi:uncharacterized peroxidase-related enzyme
MEALTSSPKISAQDPSTATGKAKEVMEGLQKKLGVVPNLFRTMSHAPNVLEGYLAFSDSLTKGKLQQHDKEQIALYVAVLNNCTYCIAAHSFFLSKLGYGKASIELFKEGRTNETKSQPILDFVKSLVQNNGHVAQSNIDKLKEAGFVETEIVEIIGVVGINMFTNYLAIAAHPTIDFPEIEA